MVFSEGTQLLVNVAPQSADFGPSAATGGVIFSLRSLKLDSVVDRGSAFRSVCSDLVFIAVLSGSRVPSAAALSSHWVHVTFARRAVVAQRHHGDITRRHGEVRAGRGLQRLISVGGVGS